jgi:hypothetical protein
MYILLLPASGCRSGSGRSQHISFLKVKSKKQKAGNVPAQSGMVSNNDEPGLKEE